MAQVEVMRRALTMCKTCVCSKIFINLLELEKAVLL